MIVVVSSGYGTYVVPLVTGVCIILATQTELTSIYGS